MENELLDTIDETFVPDPTKIYVISLENTNLAVKCHFCFNCTIGHCYANWLIEVSHMSVSLEKSRWVNGSIVDVPEPRMSINASDITRISMKKTDEFQANMTDMVQFYPKV